MDAATQYGQHIPSRVIADVLSFPHQDEPRFLELVEIVVKAVNQPRERRTEGMNTVFGTGLRLLTADQVLLDLGRDFILDASR